MSKWEINLGSEWKPLGDAEIACLDKLVSSGAQTGELEVRGQRYCYDLKAMTQTNMVSKRSRRIRNNVPTPPTPVASRSSSSALSPTNANGLPPRVLFSSASVNKDDSSAVVQVWLAGEWKALAGGDSREIVRRQAAGDVQFKITSKGHSYMIDLEHMTQRNLSTQRTRTIRFASATSDPAVGFDQFREAFHKRVPEGKLTDKALQKTWPAEVKGDDFEQLLNATVSKVIDEMSLRRNPAVDIMEWNHYWALERDSPSFHAGKEVNEKLREALKKDPQVLGRMQMHFETAVGETGSHGGLSSEGLLKACERLVASPQNVIEKQWAAEVLQKRKEGEGPDDDAELSYYDFLNVMLGRKKYSVEIWMYDISDGVARNWSWLLLGQTFEGIWHTGVVVNWPGKSSEFWFGGALFESEPGTTPFGQPIFKRPLGHTYKLRPEVWDIVARQFAAEFTKESYDVLTHNCNHFSDKLSMFLLNDHIPDEIRKQPEMVMGTLTARALRPLLNQWLGGFDDKEGRATDGGEEERATWKEVLSGALIVFSKEEGGRPQVGKVVDKCHEDCCTVLCLDYWRGSAVELDVPRSLVVQVLQRAGGRTDYY